MGQSLSTPGLEYRYTGNIKDRVSVSSFSPKEILFLLIKKSDDNITRYPKTVTGLFLQHSPLNFLHNKQEGQIFQCQMEFFRVASPCAFISAWHTRKGNRLPQRTLHRCSVVSWSSALSRQAGRHLCKGKKQTTWLKTGKGLELTFLQRRYTNGQQTYETMLSITNHEGKANQNHNKIPLHTS